MPLALFTTLALAIPCPCELVGLNNSLAPSGHSDGLQSRQLLAEGVSPHTVGLGTVMPPLDEKAVRSHHLPVRDLSPRKSLNFQPGTTDIREAKTSEWHTSDQYPEKVEKVPFPNLPAVLTPLARSENLLMRASFAVAAEAHKEDWVEDAKKTDPAEGVFLVEAVEADALGTDHLEVGVEAVIPPPVPIEDIQADLLEVLGLDSQVPAPPAPQPREVPPWAATIYGGAFYQ